jgi:site-specific DNA-adenine methylase
MLLKRYKAAPLPFQGQKRNFVEPFVGTLKELSQSQDIKVVVDLFGGSGLLSHTAKRVLPGCKVIYNDYDGFSARLRGVERTNELLTDIRVLLYDCSREKRLSEAHKSVVLSRIEKEEKSGFVDYITLSSSLLFSANYVTNFDQLKASTLFNNVKMKDYDLASDYLNGLDIVKCDYLELFERYKDVPGVLFIVDPPYLTTDTKTYRSDAYWKLKDYLDVLNVLANNNYVFFTSNKSSLVELCEWFALNYGLDNPFTGSVLNTHNVSLNKQAKYTDMMFYKFVA